MWTHEKHVQQKLPNPNPKWTDWEKRKSEFIFLERTGEIEPDPPFVVCQSRSSCLAANCTISPNPLINSPFYFIFYNKVYIFIILWQILQSKSFKVLDIYIYIYIFFFENVKSQIWMACWINQIIIIIIINNTRSSKTLQWFKV